MSLQDLSQLLRVFREENGLTYAKFAECCGLSTATVWKIEEMCVKPDVGSITKLAHGMSRHPEEILGIYYQDNERDPVLEEFLRELHRLGREEDIPWTSLSAGSIETLLCVLRQVIDLEFAITRCRRKSGASEKAKRGKPTIAGSYHARRIRTFPANV